MRRFLPQQVFLLFLFFFSLYHTSAFSKEDVGEAAFFRLEEDIVRSASKYEQNLFESPHAVSIITKEDIEKSGTIDLVQLFRFTTGVMVFEQGVTSPDVGFRGSPQQFAPRFLILKDGVPLNLLMTNGVFWQQIPISLSNIERIEIVRGASSTLYGANAFTGVVNIISKKVEDQESFFLSASGGNLRTFNQEMIWTRPISQSVRLRLSSLFRNDNGYATTFGDRQRFGQGSGELETDLTDRTHLNLSLSGRYSFEEFPLGGITQPINVGDFIGNISLNHDFSPHQKFNFRISYQLNSQDGVSTRPYTQDIHQVDSSLQYTHKFHERDTLVVGGNFREEWDKLIAFLPNGFQVGRLANFFVNNDFRILNNLILTTGGRYEYDSLTENELSGRANLTWIPFDRQSLRISIARAVRTPSLAEDRVSILGLPAVAPTLPPGTILNVVGNGNLKKESVLAAEFGYLGDFLQNHLRADIQFYFNDIKDAIFTTVTFDPTSTPPMINNSVGNSPDGQVLGVESTLTFRFFDWWTSSAGYTFTHQRGFSFSRFPQSIVNFKNRFTFKNGFSNEILFTRTDPYQVYEHFFGNTSFIGSIWRLDARIAQKLFKDRVELSIVGQNLIDSPHAETAAPGNQVDRRVFGTVSFSY